MFVCTTAATKPRERNNEQRNLENETTKQTMLQRNLENETTSNETSRTKQRNKRWEMRHEPRERNKRFENETTKQTMRDETWTSRTKQTMRDETWTSRMQRNKWWEMNLERWRYPMMKMRDATKRDERCNL